MEIENGELRTRMICPWVSKLFQNLMLRAHVVTEIFSNAHTANFYF